MHLRTRPPADRVLLGVGLALLTILSLVVVWKYFGQGDPVIDGVVVLFAFCSLVAVVARWRDRFAAALRPGVFGLPGPTGGGESAYLWVLAAIVAPATIGCAPVHSR